ncbi:hypothetical protein [Streptomyces rhizosphaericus]|uniref:DUF5753 domain-containing protein n=1 Tax=Streptomyces rhizosphaericus TaxID=114699 RepID=A0A6G4ASE1_9ACTN|nr:hypothetical protein [Streptomyces rhizosphaericus]NEW75491.1 hypothetical protein [Streptomyces rhizosphaericus]
MFVHVSPYPTFLLQSAHRPLDGAIADLARFVYLDGLAHGPAVELIERAVSQGG